MPIRALPPPAEIEPDPPRPDELVLLWRIDQFERLGFPERDAWHLARSEADLGLARRLRTRGCALELALRILG